MIFEKTVLKTDQFPQILFPGILQQHFPLIENDPKICPHVLTSYFILPAPAILAHLHLFSLTQLANVGSVFAHDMFVISTVHCQLQKRFLGLQHLHLALQSPTDHHHRIYLTVHNYVITRKLHVHLQHNVALFVT